MVNWFLYCFFYLIVLILDNILYVNFDEIFNNNCIENLNINIFVVLVLYFVIFKCIFLLYENVFFWNEEMKKMIGYLLFNILVV